MHPNHHVLMRFARERVVELHREAAIAHRRSNSAHGWRYRLARVLAQAAERLEPRAVQERDPLLRL